MTITAGTFTINKATATVTADDKTKVAGEADPEFTATVEGTVGNDVLNYELSRATGETAGTYAITPSGDAVQGNYNVTYVPGTLTITLPACPTLGTTTYTPNPVTGSATTITLTTPVNNLAMDEMVTSSQYTVQVGANTSTVTGNVSNGEMTGIITITTAMRGKVITVTPSITTADCSNPGTVTGEAVEICVPYATRPTLANGATIGAGISNKKELFKNEGVTIKAIVTNFVASQVESYGFLISENLEDIQSYNSAYNSDPSHVIQCNTIDVDTFLTKVNMSKCGRTTYYRAYIKLNGCEEPVYSAPTSFVMWGPENFAITANPSTSIASGTTVTLTANAYMTVGSWSNDYAEIISDCVSTLVTSTYAPLEDWIAMFYQASHASGFVCSIIWATAQSKIQNALGISDFGQVEFSYRWDNGTVSKTRTVNPTTTTTYTCYGDFTYKNVTCTISTTKQIVVQ